MNCSTSFTFQKPEYSSLGTPLCFPPYPEEHHQVRPDIELDFLPVSKSWNSAEPPFQNLLTQTLIWDRRSSWWTQWLVFLRPRLRAQGEELCHKLAYLSHDAVQPISVQYNRVPVVCGQGWAEDSQASGLRTICVGILKDNLYKKHPAVILIIYLQSNHIIINWWLSFRRRKKKKKKKKKLTIAGSELTIFICNMVNSI